MKTSYLWTASDPAYATVNGDDILQDVAIGRLPASFDDALYFVTDNADEAGNFRANTQEIVRELLAGRDTREIHMDDLGAAVMRDRIVTALDDGASLVSYVGHGAIHLLADEHIFDTADVATLGAQAQQPLFVTMNCLNGFFYFPFFDSLAESMVKAENKGAIAAFSPSGLSLDAPAHLFHRALIDAVFNGGHLRLGDAVLEAQEAYAATGAFPELLSIYHLFGDPALEIAK